VALAEIIPNLGRRRDCPTVNSGVNLVELRLTPVEGFVLSRVDGRTSYEVLSQMTGLGTDATFDILRKLKRDQIILNPGEEPRTVETGPRTGARSRTRGGIATLPPSILEIHDDGSAVDAAALADGPGLDGETKARILRLHRRLRSLKPHELLGLSPGADAAMVKRAYFAASKELHPDRYYGKDLGGFRDKLSDIFAQLTRAFEQLKK